MTHSRRRFVALISGALAVAGLTFSPGPPAYAEGPDEITRTITHNGRTLTARMHPVDLRAPGFEVLLQKSDGTFDEQQVGAERTWLGGVDGEPGAVASGIVRSDGVFEGTIVFDRGATWRFRDASVFETRGLTPPTQYRWPSASDAARNVSTSPGQAGSTTHRFDLGFDLANDWFTHSAVGGSVPRALDAVESTAAAMLALYESNALLRPALGRVVIRGAVGVDPYADDVDPLGKARTEWSTRQSDAGVDNVVLQHTPTGGGGTAWVGTSGTTSGVSQNAGAGANWVIIRHEVGHNWGAFDNHTNGPEGASVESGNQYHRFDGTEVSAIFRYRDSRQRSTAPFTPAGVFTEPLPPYAALDLVDGLDATVPVSFRPTANDHDANGDALTLSSVASTSHAGGTLTRSGDVVTYTPPPVQARTVDWAEYVVRDASGKTATGVMLLRVDPYVATDPTTWPAQDVTGSAYTLLNRQSGLLAAPPSGATGTATLVQRSGEDAATRWSVRSVGTGVELRNDATGLCADVNGGSSAEGASVLQYACHGGANQQWRTVAHPRGDTALVNVRSGKCLAPRDGSVLGGAELVQVGCGLSTSQAWKVTLPPVGTWPVLTPPTGSVQELVNAGSGLHAGVPVGSAASTPLRLMEKGAGTGFTFVANPDGTWRLRLEADGRCADDAGGAHTSVVTWGCGSANTNQKFRVLQHPRGGVALLGVGSDECLATEGGATTPGTRLTLEPCGAGDTVRWRVEPSAASFFESTADVPIPDSSSAGVTSPLTVNRPGAAPVALKVRVDLVHPWIGDLVVELVAPDGTAYLLHNRTGGSADDIHTTYTVDASSEAASGTWLLRVKDLAAQDVGYVDGWSLTF